MSVEPTLEQRKVIYRARRGLKELDIYFDPYVKTQYLNVAADEQALFEELVEQEDPDLLDWFMAVSEPENKALLDLIAKMKGLVHNS